MLLCKDGCDRPVCNSEDLCHVCVRAAGAAEERARGVAMLRRERDNLMHVHNVATGDDALQKFAQAQAAALAEMADRIERGET